MFIIFLLLLSFSKPVYAGEVLTWDDCVREVSANNLDLKSGRETVNVFKYRKKGAWSEFLPSIDAGINTSRGNSNTALMSDSSSYAASLSVTQNLFSGFQSRGKLLEAEANLEAQEATYRSVKANVGYELRAAFAQLVYAQNYVVLSENIIKRRKDNLDIVQLRFEGGMENKGSLLLSKASLEDAEYDYSQALHILDVARQRLANVLGRQSLSADVQITGTIPSNDPEANVNINEIALNTPGYQISKSQVKAYKANLTIARSAFYPSLDFTGSTSKQGDAWPMKDNSWSVMLSLSIPLFSGGRDFYGTYSASSLLASSSYDQENTNLQIILSLKQAYNDFVDSIQRVKVYKSYVIAASTRAEIARNKYNNGLLSFENWDIIENDLISRQRTAAQTVRDSAVAEANWLKVQGKGFL